MGNFSPEKILDPAGLFTKPETPPPPPVNTVDTAKIEADAVANAEKARLRRFRGANSTLSSAGLAGVDDAIVRGRGLAPVEKVSPK